MNFSKCKEIGSYAFYDAIGARACDLEFPQCEIIGEGAFYNTNAIMTASFPKCTTIKRFAFCPKATNNDLSSIYFPECKHIEERAFFQNVSLTNLMINNCLSIDDYAFAYCNKIQHLDCLNCEYIGIRAFD